LIFVPPVPQPSNASLTTAPQPSKAQQKVQMKPEKLQVKRQRVVLSSEFEDKDKLTITQIVQAKRRTKKKQDPKPVQKK